MTQPTLESALAQAARAWDDGDYAGVRDAASVAASLDPESVEALHYLAAALSALGQASQADRAWHEVLARAPDDPGVLLGAAEHLVAELEEDGDALTEVLALCGRGRRMARDQGDAELEAELEVVEARAWLGLGRPDEALPLLEGAEARAPGYLEAPLHRGIALFELLQLPEAQAVLEAVLAEAPDEALAHWTLGLVLERRGTGDPTRHLERARRLDPQGFPAPITLSENAFADAVEAALARLPAKVLAYLENVAVAIEPLPQDDDLLAETPPLSPGILGLFRGAPLAHKQSDDPWAHFPSSIVLYQRNLERMCRSREELIEQIDVTVLHEVGHFLGLDEDDLRRWGLD